MPDKTMTNKMRTFIIAEAGVNHNGNLTTAHHLIDAAVKSGADAVKFQTFKAENLVISSAPKAEYQSRNLGDVHSSQFKMLKELELGFEEFCILKEYCDKKGILFLSTPFDYESADFLESLVDRYKISSGDCTNYPFLKYISRKGKPVILSTGMTTVEEVSTAVSIFKNSGNSLSLLHCTTNYPCPFSDVNLRAMLTLKEKFNVPVGYSDHTKGIEVSIASVALGAEIVEKHFTLDCSMPGPDHRASLEPDELTNLIMAVRNVEISLGDGLKQPRESELEIRTYARRSLVFRRAMKAGDVISEDDLVLKRPGFGLSADRINDVVGKRLVRNVSVDDLVEIDGLEA